MHSYGEMLFLHKLKNMYYISEQCFVYVGAFGGKYERSVVNQLLCNAHCLYGIS